MDERPGEAPGRSSLPTGTWRALRSASGSGLFHHSRGREKSCVLDSSGVAWKVPKITCGIRAILQGIGGPRLHGNTRHLAPTSVSAATSQRPDGAPTMSTNAASARPGTAWDPSPLVPAGAGNTAADRLTSRIGAVLFLLGLIVLVISTQLHPAHENPMDNPVVFREYAQSDLWIAVHLGQFTGFLLVIGGLVALYFSIAIKPDAAAAVTRFGLAAAITTGASFTILQAVDGVALKRAVDAWASA
jgi:hypothetical protein